MIRRLALAGVAAASLLVSAAVPVLAGGEDASLVDGTTRLVERTVNSVLKDVPSPDGWNERHVCAWNDTVDKSLCVYFPWPI